MSAKGWTITETIGIAVVNTRAVSNAIRATRFHFKNEKGSLFIDRYSIIIEGQIEAAAVAFAEDVLKNAKINPDLNYLNIIGASIENGKYTLTLLEQGLGIIDPDVWLTFKSNVESICNNLTVFI